jgi:disulfide bond formation protein DsbB
MVFIAATPTKPCDEPAFLIPGLPLSMAAMNTIYGLALAALAFRGARPA